MAGIRTTILQGLFNFTEPTDPGDSYTGGVQPNLDAGFDAVVSGASSELEQDLAEIAERLDILCASSFNVATLSFVAGTQSTFTNKPPIITECEQFLTALAPTLPSSRLFIHKIRSLQALLVDTDSIRLNYSTIAGEHDLTSQCDNILSCIQIDFERLLSAAWEAGQRQEHLKIVREGLGVNSFDYCKYLYA
jgi:hypothetical protein